ncbi:OmpA family protein [Paracoccus fistulariae]|uniref:OmpA family protein n=1 Tax=Paracoccus fistulariae TaxID=658446 RepID=A0ABY7SM18_9RHOB|nr:OmpA family protein [Paracoccus fistulariae]MDB6179961.1 OmpA family protein [Paracoccus fistulariae]WCR08055.1 OmpA family protein [Paracoccus fistulariae]
MRRIIHNTTAIAACMSLLAPHLALAQTEMPEAAADEQMAEPLPLPEAEAEAAPVEDPAAEVTGEEMSTEAPADSVEAEAEPDVEPVPAEEAAEEPAETMPAEEVAEEPTEATPAEEVVEEPAESMPSEEPVTEPTAEPETMEDAVTEEPAQPEMDAAEDMAEPAEDPATDPQALEEALAEETAKENAEDSEMPAEEAEATATEAQSDPVEDPTMPETAPEAEAEETEAAKEAAAATELPAAAALDDDATDGQITEENVTEENSRSSDEDFATSLSDARETATGTDTAAAAQAASSKDDDDNDLGKALLLGLGGVAVGAMLSNNRQVQLSTPDRVVVTRADGSQQIIKDEVALLRQPGSTVTTENFDDGSSRSIVTRADGSKVITIRDADLRVLRRTLVSPDGSSTRLIDETVAEPVDLAALPAPVNRNSATAASMNEDQLRAALLAESAADRRFTLAQIRDIPQVRSLVAPVDIDAITFDTGSAAIKPDQAQELALLGDVIRKTIADNPREVFLIEGYTDTVGSDAANLALSDRRAESVALALSEYFDVPPENLVVQGYGERFLKINRDGDIRENRRASVRRITDLLQSTAN